MKAKSIIRQGYLVMTMKEPVMHMHMHIYETWDFDGTPEETEEMRPQWFLEEAVPLSDMWPDDKYWLPLLFASKPFTGR